MWLNCTRTQVNPADMGQMIKILVSEVSLAPIRAAPGFCGLLLVESTETAGEILSLTWWESAEEGQAYLASPQCRGVIEGVQEYLVRPLERQYYEVYLEVAPQVPSVNGECG